MNDVEQRPGELADCNFYQAVSAYALYPALLGAGLVGALVVASQTLAFDSFGAFGQSLLVADQWLIYWTVLYLVGPTLLQQLKKESEYPWWGLVAEVGEVFALFLVLAAAGNFGPTGPTLPLWAAYVGIILMPIFAGVGRWSVSAKPRWVRSGVVVGAALLGLILARSGNTGALWIPNAVLFAFAVEYLLGVVRREWEAGDRW